MNWAFSKYILGCVCNFPFPVLNGICIFCKEAIAIRDKHLWHQTPEVQNQQWTIWKCTIETVQGQAVYF